MRPVHRLVIQALMLAALSFGLTSVTDAQVPMNEWPVVFVHGFCADSSMWNTLLSSIEADARYGSNSGRTRLYFDGAAIRRRDDSALSGIAFPNTDTSKRLFTLDFCSPATGTFDSSDVAQLSISYKAYELRQALSEIKRISGSASVIVVGHSLGGVVARAYAQGFASSINDKFGQNTLAYQSDTPLIVTIDSPHAGATEAVFSSVPDLFADIGCTFEGSRNQLELVPGSRVYDLLNLTKASDTLPSQWKGVDHSIPSNVNIASIASYDPLKFLTPFTRAGGDGVVPYKSQNLQAVKNGLFSSLSNIVNVDNRISFGTPYSIEFHTTVYKFPQTIALVR